MFQTYWWIMRNVANQIRENIQKREKKKNQMSIVYNTKKQTIRDIIFWSVLAIGAILIHVYGKIN